MRSPWDIYLDWYDAISENLQREIAFCSLNRTPDVESSVEDDDPHLVQIFRDWLCGKKADGKLLIVREETDSIDLGQYRNAYEVIRAAYLTTEALNRWMILEYAHGFSKK